MQLFITHYKILELIIAYKHTPNTHHIITSQARAFYSLCGHIGQALISIIRSAFYLTRVRVISRHLIKNINLYRPHEIDYITVIIIKNGNTAIVCSIRMFINMITNATIIDFYFDFMPSYAMVN